MILFSIMLVLDIFINLSTGYFEKGELILFRPLIVKNWVKHMMLFDVLPALVTCLAVYDELLNYNPNNNSAAQLP